MRQQERQILNAVIDELDDVRQSAPDSATYSQGRTSGSIAYRLSDMINLLCELVDDGGDNERTADE